MVDKPDNTESLLSLVKQISVDYLANDEAAPVASPLTPVELRERLDRDLSDLRISDEAIIRELADDMEPGLNRGTSGRFFGWVLGGSLPVALAADWLTSTWDQNPGFFACSPGQTILEEITGRWLKELLGLPSKASFAFVTGGQMANTTCLAAARNSVLAKHGWDVEAKGLIGAPAVKIISGTRHGTVDRAVRLLGLGLESLIDIETDNKGRLIPEVVRQELESNSEFPLILLTAAGDVNTGESDNFEEIIPIAHEYGAWVHVDGAFGLWAQASPTLKHLLSGVERADSWATDGHKWLNVPYDCGYAFIADTSAHRASMSHRASYIAFEESARDPMDWNPEHSKRGRATPTYAAIRSLGREGIADLIERTCKFADAIVKGIGSLEGSEIVSPAFLNQGLVRFKDLGESSKESDHDELTDRMIAAINSEGTALVSGTTWRGRRCMRVSVSGWKTDESDVERTIAAVAKVLQGTANL